MNYYKLGIKSYTLRVEHSRREKEDKTSAFQNMTQEKKFHQHLILLSMFYILCVVLGYLFSNKELHFPGLGTASPGVFVLTLSFTLLDVIAEVYGYQISKQVIWAGLIAQALFCFVSVGLAMLPDPGSRVVAYTPAADYQSVFGILPRTFLSTFIGYLAGNFINTYLIVRWKALLRGRYFWLRSVGSSAVGDAIYTGIGVFLVCIGRYPISMIPGFILTSYLVVFMSSIIYAYPAGLIVSMLKRAGPSDFQHAGHVNFNPFKSPLG